MKTSSAKDKGRRLQKHVVNQLVERLGVLEEDVESRPMSSGGEDVIMSSAARELFPFSIECKNTEKASVWKWIEQAKENSNGHTPIVVFKRNRAKEYVLIDFDSFLDIISQRNELIDADKEPDSLVQKLRNEILFLKEKLGSLQYSEEKDWDMPKEKFRFH